LPTQASIPSFDDANISSNLMAMQIIPNSL